MPIVSPNDSAPQKPIPTVPVIAKPQYKGVTVDTTVVPLSNLLSHVEGSSWTVNYYSQVLDLDSPTAGQGLGVSPIHQQYRLIKGMELKVTGPLTASQDPESKNMTYRGAASVYPFIIPNEGDMFLADIGAGREGVFQVTDVVRMSVFKQAVHSIEYIMVDYATPERLVDLDEKVVQTFFYAKDFLRHGQNPLLFEEDYEVTQFLRRNYLSWCERYFKSFFSREYTTMILPGQKQATYDHYLVKSLLQVFSTWDCEQVRYVRQLNTEDDYSLRATTVWDAILKRDKALLRDSFTQYGLVSAGTFTSDPMLEGIRYSGIHQVIYPVDATLTVDYNQYPVTKLVSGLLLQRAPDKLSISSLLTPSKVPLREKVPQVIDGMNLTGEDGVPIPLPFIPPVIHPAMADGWYMFSQAFYKNERLAGQQSQLELMVHDYLDGKELNIKRLKSFCVEMENWGTLDRFYFTPVVLILIKAALRNI